MVDKRIYVKEILKKILLISVFIMGIGVFNVTKVLAADVQFIASDEDFNYIMYRDADNNLHINDKVFSSSLNWERIYYVSGSGWYTRRTQNLYCTQSDIDWSNVEYGSYNSTYTKNVSNVFRVKVNSSAKYKYYYSSYTGRFFNSYEDVLGQDTRYNITYTDPFYLIINADTGKIIDLDWNLNFYYYNKIEKRQFIKGIQGDMTQITIPDVPKSIKTSATSNSIELSWNHVSRATSYDIEIDGEIYPNILINKYLHKDLTQSSEHTYRVRACNSVGASDWSEVIKETVLLNIPSNVRTISTSFTTSVEWESVEGATGYDVEIDGEVIDNGSQLCYTKEALMPNSNHTYRVRGKNNNLLGEWSSLLSVKTAPDVPLNISAIHSNNSVKIDWKAQTGATGYNILIDEDMFTTTALTYTYITSDTHSYKIRSFSDAGVSDWSNVILKTAPPVVSNIAISNNKTGMDDIVYIKDLATGDVVNVYDAATGGKLLGTGVVENGESSISVIIPQVGVGAGKVYVTVIKGSDEESSRVAQSFTSETSASLAATAITVVNNYIGTDDTIKVTGLTEGDVINVYDTASGGTLIGSKTVESGSSEVTISTPQLGSSAGNIYVTVTKLNKLESARTKKAYAVEPTTAALSASAITVVNNKAGMDDTVTVTGLTEGDIINVYSAASGGTLLGSATVKGEETEVTISIEQVGVGVGNVYVTIKKEGKLESARTAKAFTSETSASLAATAITVVNNYIGTDDTIKVTGLTEGDVINVYDTASGGTLIGSKTVESGSSEVTISTPQLGSSAGNIYVTVTKLNKLESARTKKAYAVEPTTAALSASAITVVNNKAGMDDTVTVTGLTEGDIINVYSAASGGTLLGSATVKGEETEVTISIEQVGVGVGNVYVTIKKEGKLESARTAKAFTSETSASLAATAITVVNNYIGTDDTIKVTGLTEGDVINVYDTASGGTLIGSKTVESGSSEVTISTPQLGSSAGNIYVTVTKLNKLESARTKKAYAVEPTTAALSASAITVVNNKAGMDDTVTVTGLTEGDIINVYSAASGGTLLGSATVKGEETEVTISIEQVGVGVGNVYVTIKKEGKLESARTAKAFTSETSASLAATAITVVNNYIGTDDTIKVTGLTEGDVINVYDTASGGTLIGSKTVESGSSEVTISTPQLGSSAGNIYVTVTKLNKLESARTKKAYAVEPTTAALSASAITVVNNKAGMDDTVTVTGLTEGDIINVYSAASGGTLLGSATVKGEETEVTISIEQVGVGVGNVYVTIKKEGKLESARTAKAFTSETSASLAATAITVVNNYIGTDDTIKVTGLTEGDVINVYDTASGGTLIGSKTVESGSSEVTISTPQLGSSAGNIYVTVTKLNKLESARTKKAYAVEPTTAALSASAITVVNNKAGMDDTVTVTGLTEGDIINVYSAASGGTLLGSATVNAEETEVTINIEQLGTGSGKVYISLRNVDKAESARTAQSYSMEPTFEKAVISNSIIEEVDEEEKSSRDDKEVENNSDSINDKEETASIIDSID
ncbi:MAG: fibronectin type III domain-containing protein [Candidatus Galacturonibacter soehngenii]|nr:fibronectin type III domain-containing protein [Candidatus Galacturonibacter soehngenii]